MAPRRRKLLICEGAEDQALVQAFIDAGLLANDFRVEHIGDRTGTGQGIWGLQAYLEAAPAAGILSGITAIGILADNDMAGPQGPVVKYIQNSLRNANAHAEVKNRLSMPTGPHVRTTNRKIATTIVLLPGGDGAGCLETLLLTVLRKLHGPQMASAEAYLDEVRQQWPNPAYSLAKLDKARLRVGLAILHRVRPQIQLSNFWLAGSNAANLIPVADPLFTPLIGQLAAV